MRATVITDSIAQTRIPGAVKFWQALDGVTPGMTFKCPCCGKVLGNIGFGFDGWDWNRVWARPSVSRAIILSEPDGRGGWIEHYRGLLTNGEWIRC